MRVGEHLEATGVEAVYHLNSDVMICGSAR
jgi:hypothetical protein